MLAHLVVDQPNVVVGIHVLEVVRKRFAIHLQRPFVVSLRGVGIAAFPISKTGLGPKLSHLGVGFAGLSILPKSKINVASHFITDGTLWCQIYQLAIVLQRLFKLALL